jgi:hypothetical protein
VSSGLVVKSGIPIQEERAVTNSLYKVQRMTRGCIQYAVNESLAIHNHVITDVSVTSHCARPLNGTEI